MHTKALQGKEGKNRNDRSNLSFSPMILWSMVCSRRFHCGGPGRVILDVYYVSVASFMILGIASLPLAWQHLRKEDVRKVYKCEKGVFSVCLLT